MKGKRFMKEYHVVAEAREINYLTVMANSEEEAKAKVEAIMESGEGCLCFSYDEEETFYNGSDTEYGITLVDEVKVCCICGKEEGYNNAEPYTSGYCCNKCNTEYVIPARITAISLRG